MIPTAFVRGRRRCFLVMLYIANRIRILPKMIFKTSGLMIPARYAQAMVKIILGIPNKRKTFLFRCLRKKLNLETFPKI